MTAVLAPASTEAPWPVVQRALLAMNLERVQATGGPNLQGGINIIDVTSTLLSVAKSEFKVIALSSSGGSPIFSYEVPLSSAVARQAVLSDFDEYAADNWDGEGAQGITWQTLAAARTFLRRLPDWVSDPAAAPGEDGTVGFEWIYSRGPIRKTFIDIGPGEELKLYSRTSNGQLTSRRLKVSEFSASVAEKVFPIGG